MTQTSAEQNKALVLKAFDTLFNKRDYETADIVRFEDGLLAEHWEVLQNEATKAESKSGLPMFGDSFSA